MGREPEGFSNPIQRWHIYIALLGILLACGRVIFYAGGTDASTQSEIKIVQEQQKKDESDYARKDLVDLRLQNIENSQKKMEEKLDDQSKTLEQIRLELKSRR